MNPCPELSILKQNARFLKGSVAVTFDDFFNIFVQCINYSFLFYYPKYVETPSIWLVNADCCVKYIVIVQN